MTEKVLAIHLVLSIGHAADLRSGAYNCFENYLKALPGETQRVSRCDFSRKELYCGYTLMPTQIDGATRSNDQMCCVLVLQNDPGYAILFDLPEGPVA